MNVPDNCKYSDSHEWVLPQGDTATVGITDHAQAELTDIVFVELPKVGAAAEAGKPVCIVESVKAASDIYSPVTGEVTEVNTALEGEPGLVNSSPHGDGWLFKVRLADSAELDRLKDAAAYQAQIG